MIYNSKTQHGGCLLSLSSLQFNDVEAKNNLHFKPSPSLKSRKRFQENKVNI